MKSGQETEDAERLRRRIEDLEEELDISPQRADVTATSREGRQYEASSSALLEFLLGVALATAGAYFLINQIVVTSGFMSMFGPATFGVLLVPFVLGVALITFGHGKGTLGVGLVVVSLLLMLGDVLSGLRMYFRPATLIQVLLMFSFLAAGIGLIVRALRMK